MATKNPMDVAKKWSRNLGNAVADMQKSIDAMTVSPMEQAAQSKDAWQAGLQRAMADGTWEAGLRKVSLSDWKQKMIKLGLPRVADGAQKAEGRVVQVMTKLLPLTAAISAEVRAMPKATEQDRFNRMVANYQRMKALKGQL